MGFKRFWQRIELPHGQHVALIQQLCEAAYEQGLADGYDIGHEEGWHEGSEFGYFDRQTELRIVQ